MKRYYLILLSLCQLALFGQGYSRVEYFIDTDPGIGKATTAPLPVADSTQFVTNISAVGSGLHTLYIRVKDSKGNWSQTISRPFMKQAVPRDATISITKAEYFVDTDPGYGKATNIASISGETIDATVDLSSIASGLHSLYLRTLDTQGHWSQTISRPFMRSNFKISNPNIVAAEYFIDAVGDFGKGKAVTVSPQSNSVIIDVLADLKNLTLGNHTFYVRAKDNNGQWSMIQNLAFQVVTNTAFISLSDNEKLTLYPNPTIEGFRLKGIEGKATLTLYSMKGEVLLTKPFVENEAISVSKLPKGIYSLRIQTTEGVIEKKLVKN